MKKIRIVVFDDNLFFRQSIQIMMDGRNDIELIGAFESANDLVNDIKFSAPDMVLMDIDMPGTNGIDAVKILKQNFPKLPVMMLTDYDREKLVVDSICAGADGYTLKTSTGDKIIESIHDVYNGNASLSASVARRVLDLFSKKFSARVKDKSFLLSPRETQVLTLLVQGKPYKTIAHELDITYDTVRAHIKHIYKKLHVSSISGAVAKAMQHRLVRVA